MEWVEITAKTLDEAREAAADRLGVAEDEMEFEVLEEPRSGLFGLTRGAARVRARIKPADLRPKQERRRSRRGSSKRSDDAGDETTKGPGPQRSSAGSRGSKSKAAGGRGRSGAAVATLSDDDADADDGRSSDDDSATRGSGTDAGSQNRRSSGGRGRDESDGGRGGRGGRGGGRNGGGGRGEGDDGAEDVDPAAVGAAAVKFMEGLSDSFGAQATVELLTDGVDLDVRVDGEGLGLMVGSGGKTLLAIQDLVRVAAQRRLGDHTTRLKIDIAGYRERRRQALEEFARQVAAQVIESGVARAMEPMPSADRKVIHDVLVEIDGVESGSEGDDPNRRVIVSPA